MDIRRALPALLLAAALALGAPAEGAFAAPAEPPPLRVLFIGNSLTYFNDLPRKVEAVARATGGPKVVARSIAYGGYSLEDHWLGNTFNTWLDARRWDFVVLQQGPSALPSSRLQLRRDVALIADLVRRAGAEPAVYMVWPETYRSEYFGDVIESHRLAAADVGARLLPAGRAWQLALARDPALKLYGGDGFHPAPLGSLLAAIVIYEGLSGRSAAAQPWSPRRGDRRLLAATPAELAALLDAAALARAELPATP